MRLSYLNSLDYRFVVISLLAILLSCLIAWVTPVFSIPDEGAHYLRAFEVSRGHLVNPKGNVGVPIPCRDYLVIAKQYAPVAFYQQAAEEMKPNSGECVVNTVNTAGTYSPLPYFAVALGIRVAEELGYSIETRLKVGRMMNAVLTSAFCLMAIMLVQRSGMLLAAFAMMPMSLWLRSSISADAMTITISICYLAYLLYLIEKDEIISRQDIIILSIFAVFLGSMKPVYGILSFSSIILFKQSNARLLDFKNLLILLAPGVAALLVGMIWIALADPSLVYINIYNGADPELQVQQIINHPEKILLIIKNTFENQYAHFVSQALLPTLTISPWLKHFHSLTLASILLILILCTMLSTPTKLMLWQRMVLLFVSATCLFVVFIPMYLTYTLVGHNEILGLQGRYFLPLSFYGIIACSFQSSKYKFSLSAQLISVVISPIIISVLLISYYFFR